MNLATDLGGIFFVLDVTALAFVQIINMSQTEPWETDWIAISAEEATILARFVYFQSCFEIIHARQSHDTVQANSGSIPRLERHLE